MLEIVEKGTARPSIITEFGQACCATNGACENCPGTYDYNGVAVGYDEAVIQIAQKHGVSWIPWVNKFKLQTLSALFFWHVFDKAGGVRQ